MDSPHKKSPRLGRRVINVGMQERAGGGRHGRFGSTGVSELLPKEGYLMKMEERDKTRKTRLYTRGEKIAQGEFSDRINKVIIESEKKIQGKTELLRAIDKLPIGNVSLRPNWP